MYFLRRSRGGAPLSTWSLLHLHGDMGGVVLPVAVDHKLGQHLQQQWFSGEGGWGGGGGGGRPIKNKGHAGYSSGVCIK